MIRSLWQMMARRLEQGLPGQQAGYLGCTPDHFRVGKEYRTQGLLTQLRQPLRRTLEGADRYQRAGKDPGSIITLQLHIPHQGNHPPTHSQDTALTVEWRSPTLVQQAYFEFTLPTALNDPLSQ
jgi:hypothetical protein